MTDLGTAPAVTNGEDPTHDDDGRRDFIYALRAIADYLEQSPDVPTPLGSSLARHFTSPGAYRAACEALGGEHHASSGYDSSTRRFGPLELRFQISRETLVAEREHLVARREAELTR